MRINLIIGFLFITAHFRSQDAVTKPVTVSKEPPIVDVKMNSAKITQPISTVNTATAMPATRRETPEATTVTITYPEDQKIKPETKKTESKTSPK